MREREYAGAHWSLWGHARPGPSIMIALLAFGITLLAAVLISELADRSIVSTSVLFLLAGVVLGEGVLNTIRLEPGSPVISRLAEFALVSVLLTDGMKLGWPELRSVWRLPGRALLLGLPLTLVATAVFAHAVAGLAWSDAWLVGAALSPTDPVLASAIVGREGISQRLRHLLNVESGLNDGLALPIVLGLLAVAGAGAQNIFEPIAELFSGAAIGVAVPWIALRLERTRFFAVARSHEPFFPIAIGLVSYATASLLPANAFIAAFATGVTLATLRPPEEDAFREFGERLSELLKLAALLVFGAMISPAFLAEIPLRGYVFALLALVLARPLGLGIALLGCDIGRKEKVAALWFGPKGFASVIYGLMILESGIQGADMSFHLIALVIAGSIVAHSSTDVLVARRLNGGTDN